MHGVMTENPADPATADTPVDGFGACPRARESVAEMPVERLEATLVALAQHLASGTYELLVLVGEVDHRGSWATWGALSCAAWLADVCEIEVGTARVRSGSPASATTRCSTRRSATATCPTPRPAS